MPSVDRDVRDGEVFVAGWLPMWYDSIPSPPPGDHSAQERYYHQMTERALLGALSPEDLCRAKRLDYKRLVKMVKEAPATLKAWLRLVSTSGGTGCKG
jgi:hypothetical protein